MAKSKSDVIMKLNTGPCCRAFGESILALRQLCDDMEECQARLLAAGNQEKPAKSRRRRAKRRTAKKRKR